MPYQAMAIRFATAQSSLMQPNQSSHNEKVCDLLNASGGFEDWVITTAFYSALHLVRENKFPIKVKTKEGNEIEITNLEHYVNWHGLKSKNKHTVLKGLAKSISAKCGRNYNRLHDFSQTSRYHGYALSKTKAEEARRLLREIKSELS